MKNKSIRFYISLGLELSVVVFAILGIILSMLAPKNEFMGGVTNLLYFTTQSNIWIAIVLGTIFTFKILEIINKKAYLKNWMYVVKLIFTVAITLTGIVYCFLLAPVLPEEFDTWSLHSIFEHALVPLFAVADMFIDEYKIEFKKKHVGMVIFPPLYYLIFSIIGYVCKIEYSTGENYPYFFLNFGSPAGIFGFSKEEPYIGTFYWMLMMLSIVLCFGFIYRVLFNKLNYKKIEEK